MTFHIEKSRSKGCLAVRIEGSTSDRQLADLFCKMKKESIAPSASIVYIPYPQTHSALKLLAATGRLFFNGKQLVCDLFGKTEFFYNVQKNIQITGKLVVRDQTIDIQACDFICAGPPHFFVKGVSLKMIGTDASWKELKKIYEEEPFSLEDLQELLKESKQNPNAPRIVFEGNSREELNFRKEPLPELVLKDKLGAFADLWMDYGHGKKFDFHDPQHAGNIRKYASEKAWEKDLLETGFVKKELHNSHYYCPLDKVAKSVAFLLELGWKIFDIKGNRVLKHTNVTLDLEKNSQEILIKGKIHYDSYEADLTHIAGAFNRRDRFVEIGTGVVGLLPHSWDDAGLEGILEEAIIEGDALKIGFNQIGILSELNQTPDFACGENMREMREKLQNFLGISQALPNSSFKGLLRDYQQQGVNWLTFLWDHGFHGLLADDMGLGKTVQVLAFLSRLQSEDPVLIILPTSLIFNWRREIERFLPDRKVFPYQGQNRLLESLPQNAIILTSYTTLRIDLLHLSLLNYACVILDEAQAIKNPDTQTAQAVCRLNAKFRLAITGTPIENNLTELWSHFRFLMPDLLGNQKEYEAQIQAAAADSRYLKNIKRKIKPFILRRKKEEVAKDLPERIEQVVWIEMSPAQRQVYEAFLSGVQGNLFKKVEADGFAKHRMEILEAILRLRQICCHPLLVSGHLEDSQRAESAKLDALLQDIETVIEEGKKVLVYSQFTSMLKLISKELTARGRPFVYLDGSTTHEKRQDAVDRFQLDPSLPLFLISLKAGGLGLNLTAADYIFLYDPWWNEAVENQAINRSHRIGRKETVIAKRFIVAESIEEKMMHLKAHKLSLLGDLLEEEEASIGKKLTEEDLKFLLE